MSGFQLGGDAPTLYSRFAGKIMGTWTDELIQSAHCQDGDRVLDVACGTGFVASRVNLVSQKLCAVSGIDINEGMLKIARSNPLIDWHHGSAMELPFTDGEFDVIFCQQGLQFFPDRAAAMSEMSRVLAPGGRLALNVWGALDRQPFHLAAITEIAETFGDDVKALFDLAFSLNTVAELRLLASGAGLTNIRVRFAHRTMRYPAPAGLVVGFMCSTPAAAHFLALPDDRRQASVSRVLERLASYVDDAGLAVPQENHFLTASKRA